MYKAAWYCEECGQQIIADLLCDSPPVPSEDRDDSDSWPQGPYSDGGGEADCPQHCDSCGAFLENSLTNEGYKYVCEAVEENILRGQGTSLVVKEWAEFYEIRLSDLNLTVAELLWDR